MDKIPVIEEAIKHMDSGLSQNKTASLLGIKPATLSNWLTKVKDADGDIEAAFEPKAAKGGRPKALVFSEYELALAKWFRLAKESVDVAAYFFARDERVSETVKLGVIGYEEKQLETGKRIQWPMSVRKAFYVTDEEKSAFRGKKASQQTEMVTRRGMFEVLADGTVVDILPGDTWEMDDYSTNQPYTFKNPEDGELMLGRQVLACRDLSGAKWLGFDHIGRERDAYRGEDIVRFFERLIRVHGMPKRLRLERGSWEGSGVHGIVVPGMETRWGDLRDLMIIEHVFKSKSKSIVEGGFNMLQRFLAHTGTDIGRHRGEFEEATKRYLSARRKGVDPRTLGFLTQEESSQKHHAAGQLINSRLMKRGHLNERISPDDLVARKGWHTTELNESDAWYFLPCKKLRIARSGEVEVNPGGGWPKMTFTLNGIVDGIHLENGHKILVACDPARPDLGAHICNADQSVKNRDGYGMGEFLMHAPYYGLAPQFNAAAVLTPHLVARRKATAAASTTFRAIKTAANSKGVVEMTATDGKGKSASMGSIKRPDKQPSKGEDSKKLEASSTVRSPAPQTRREPAAPAKMSRFGGRDAAAEIAKLTASLTED